MKHYIILTALEQTDPEDLPDIIQYVLWVKLRRHVKDTLYHKKAHWLRPFIDAHWL